MRGRRTANLAAGALAGLGGSGVFLLLHHVLVGPPQGLVAWTLVLGALGGLALGELRRDLRSSLPDRPWDSLLLGAGLLLAFGPAILAGLSRGATDWESLLGPAPGLAYYAFELALGAAVTASLVVYLVTRRAKTSALAAAAGACFALAWGPGLLLLSTRWEAFVPTLFVIAASCLAAAVLVNEAQRRLFRASLRIHVPREDVWPDEPERSPAQASQDPWLRR